ncbi:MAG: hypothetical protein ACFCU1_08850 [Sumerlaeia bacterium]
MTYWRIAYFFLVVFLFWHLPISLSAQNTVGNANEYSISVDQKEILVGNSFQLYITSPFALSFDPNDIPVSDGAKLVPNSLATSSIISSSSFSNPVTKNIYQLRFTTTKSGMITVGPVKVYLNTDELNLGTVQVDVKTLEEYGIINPIIPELGFLSHPISSNVEVLKMISGKLFSAINPKLQIYEGETFVVETVLYRSNTINLQGGPINEYGTQNDSLILIDQFKDPLNVSSTDLQSLPYSALTVYRQVYYPLKVGQLELSGIQTEFEFFDRRSISSQIQFKIPAPLAKIDILPLPKTDREVQAKVVGNVQVASNFIESNVNVGDLLTITYMLMGEAYLKPIVLENLPDVDGLLFIDQSSSFVQVSQKRFPVSSRKTFELKYQVLKPGEISLPRLTFAFFDPATKSYAYEQTAEYSVISTGNMAMPTALTEPEKPSNKINVDNNQVSRKLVEHPFYNTDKLTSINVFSINSKPFVLINGVLIFLCACVYIYRNYVMTSKYIQSSQQEKHLREEIQTLLDSASSSLDENNIDQAYSSSRSALKKQVRTSYNIDIEGKELREVQVILDQCGLSKVKTAIIIDFLNNLENQRFRVDKSYEQAKADCLSIKQFITMLMNGDK